MNLDFQLENLKGRMKKYGDITQNARDADELQELLRYFDNRVPSVIFFLEERVRAKGTQVSKGRASIRGCRGQACPRGSVGRFGPESKGFLSTGYRAQYSSYYSTKNNTSHHGQARK